MKKTWKVPHIYVLLFLFIVLCGALTWVLPAGEFDRVTSEEGYSVVVPGTYHEIDPSPVGPFDIIRAVYDGMVDAGNIVFFLFIASAGVGLVIQTGAMNGFVAALLRIVKGRSRVLIIPFFITVIGIASSTIGVFSESFPFIPIFVGVCIAMGYDAIVGMAIVGLACGIGYSGAAMNPFTVGLGWSLAELPQMSGVGFRVVCHAVMIVVASIYTIRYALRVQKDPRNSLVYGDDFSEFAMSAKDLDQHAFGLREKLVLLTLVAGIGAVVYGTIQYGWSYSELAGVFLAIGLISAIIMGWSPNTIAEKVTGCFESITVAALMIGIARGILLVLQDGQIIDTVVYGLFTPLSYLPSWISAVGMLILQTVLNLLIPSGSGQAATSLPIMIPLADLLDIPRQTAVLAFQFGDGLSDIMWPTGMAPIMCGLAGVKLEKWWKWLFPLIGLLVLTQAILVVISMVVWA